MPCASTARSSESIDSSAGMYSCRCHSMVNPHGSSCRVASMAVSYIGSSVEMIALARNRMAEVEPATPSIKIAMRCQGAEVNPGQSAVDALLSGRTEPRSPIGVTESTTPLPTRVRNSRPRSSTSIHARTTSPLRRCIGSIAPRRDRNAESNGLEAECAHVGVREDSSCHHPDREASNEERAEGNGRP